MVARENMKRHVTEEWFPDKANGRSQNHYSSLGMTHPAIQDQEISLGKFTFDVHRKEFLAHPSVNEFPNALTDFERICEAKEQIDQDALAVLHGQNYISGDLTLKFKYNIPLRDVREKHPGCILYLRSTYYIEEAVPEEQTLIINLGNMKAQEVEISSNFKGESTQESKINRQAPSVGEISYSLEKMSGGSLHLKTVELIARTKAPKPANVSEIELSILNKTDDGMLQKQFSVINATIDGPAEFDESGQTENIDFQEASSNGVIYQKEEREDPQKHRLPEIEKIHKTNNLASRFKKMRKLQKYQDMVEFKIPLKQLYELESACVHVDGTMFCAVIVKIQNQQILERHKYKKFLLQIWKKGGQMIFEKSLKQPVCNWNMTGDKFLFQERPNSNHIWLVHLRQEASPQIHQFNLPFNLVGGQIGTFYSKSQKRLVVPQDDGTGVQDLFGQDSDDVDDSDELTERDISRSRIEEEEDGDGDEDEADAPSLETEDTVMDAEEDVREKEQKKPFSERFKTPLIVRAPDKMLDYLDDHLILAYRHTIYYVNVSDHLLAYDAVEHQKVTDIREEDIKNIKLKDTKKILCFPELNSEQSCIVIEDINTREVSFLAFRLIDDESHREKLLQEQRDAAKERLKTIHLQDIAVISKSSAYETESQEMSTSEEIRPRKKMLLFGLSIKDDAVTVWADEDGKVIEEDVKIDQFFAVQKKKPKKKSPVLKYRSSAMLQEGSVQWDQVGLVLRQCGAVEVYADFIYVCEIFDPARPCVDIEAGRTNFFFKFVNEKAVFDNMDPKDLMKKDIEVKRVQKSWKNRISMLTLQKEKILDNWSEVLHARVAHYVKIFTELTNIQTFMLVSHQNMISVFNTGDTQEQDGEDEQGTTQWVDTVQVDKPECHIRKLSVVKKKPTEEQVQEKKTLARSMTLSMNLSQTTKKKGKKPEKITATVFETQLVQCLVGHNKIVNLEIDSRGKFKRKGKDGLVTTWTTYITRNEAFTESYKFREERVLQLVDDKTHQYGTILLLEKLNSWFKNKVSMDDFIKVSRPSECYLYNFPMLKSGKKQDMRLICIKKQQEHLLLNPERCKKQKGLLDHGCLMGIKDIRREDFIIKNRFNSGQSCAVKDAYPDKNIKILRALSISSNRETKLFPLVKKLTSSKYKGDVTISLIHKARNTRSFNPEGLLQVDSWEEETGFEQKGKKQRFDRSNAKYQHLQLQVSEEESLQQQELQRQMGQLGNNSNEEEEEEGQNKGIVLESFYLTLDWYGEERGCFIVIRNTKIRVFNQDRTLRYTYHNFKFESVMQINEIYLYAAQNANFDSIEIEEEGVEKKRQTPMKQVEGLYVYTIAALLHGKIEPYKVSNQGTGGGATLMQYNTNHNRLSFMEDYNTIVVIPLPQLNIINFIGMRNKQFYLVWREKKGMFTAMSIEGYIYTWSIGSGKLLYWSNPKPDFDPQVKYEVYQSEPKDITYTTDKYNLEKRSITLLMRTEPIKKDLDPLDDEGEKTENEKEEQDKDAEEQGNQLLKTTNVQQKIVDNFKGMSFEKCSEVFTADADCQMLDTSMKFSLYHFKVMQLRTHEDDPSIVHDCRVKFHFEHPLIRHKKAKISVVESETPNSETNNTIVLNKTSEQIETNDTQVDVGDDKTVQRLYLSMNTRYLMEVINDKFGIVYRRTYSSKDGSQDRDKVKLEEDQSEEESADDDESNFGKEIYWHLKYKITRWPSNLANRTSVPFMFSPNFKYQLDFGNKRKAIIILDTAKQKEYYQIPTSMMKTQWRDMKDEEALPLIFSRMRWVQDCKENKLHIVNESNFDCIFELIEHPDIKQRGLKLVSCVKVDNLHTDYYKPDSPHFFHEPYQLEPNFVTERLIRMNQDYKRAMQHAKNQKLFQDDHKGFVEHMVQHVQQVDYLQPWSDINSYFAIDMSFTYLDWLITEEALKNERFDMQDVSDWQKLALAQNIFPNGKGILHMLARNQKAKMAHINKLARDLFAFSSKDAAETHLLHVDEPVYLEIPFLNDYNQQTALDICLDIQPPRTKPSICPQTRKLFCSPRAFIEDLKTKKAGDLKNMIKVSSKNIMLADVILESIQRYKTLHSSHQVVDALILGTRLGLPAVKTYLESRVKTYQPPLLPMSFPKINQKFLKKCNALEGKYGTITAQIFGPINKMTERLFKKKGAPQPTRFESLDLPELHQQGDRGRDFIEALTECKDQSFFEQKSVQILIDHHYYFWYYINLYSVVVPAFTQLAVFWFWNNFILPIRMRTLEKRVPDNVLDPLSLESNLSPLAVDSWNLGELNGTFKVVLFAITFYLFSYDMTQLARNFWLFNSKDNAPGDSLWIIGNIILSFIVLASILGAEDDYINSTDFWQMQSWVALAIWIRILVTYLGEVQQFSWLVGLIKYSCNSTTTFLIVFMCFITAFADSFNAIEQKIFLNGDEYMGSNKEELKEQKIKDMDISILTNFNNWLQIWQIAFRSSLGDFNDDAQLQYYSYADWIVFFLSCFFLIILMLNLLIAIISDAQAGYTDTMVQATYREKALQINRKGNSFFWYFYSVKADPNEMLYIVQQASSREGLDTLDIDNSMQGQIEQIQKQIQIVNEGIEHMNYANNGYNEGDDFESKMGTRTASRMGSASTNKKKTPTHQAGGRHKRTPQKK